MPIWPGLIFIHIWAFGAALHPHYPAYNVSEQCSSSLMLGVVQGGWSGGGGGVQGIRVLKVELLDSCWGVDFSMGEPHVV